MNAKLVQIGNSRGIRIPKVLIEQAGLGDEVCLHAEKDRLVITRARPPRAGWGEAFRRMAEAGDDKLLLPDSLSHEWDETEWTW